MGIFSIDNLDEYRNRVSDINSRMKRLGYGAQSECARDIEEQPITISRLLRGIVVDERLLDVIDRWVKSYEKLTNQIRVA